MTNLTVRKKLILLNVLVILLILLIAIAGSVGLRKIRGESLIASLLVQESVATQAMSRGLGEFVITQGAPASAKIVRENIKKFDDAHTLLASEFSDRLPHELSEKLNANWKFIKGNIESFLTIHRDKIGDEEMIRYGKISTDTNRISTEVESIAQGFRERADRDTRNIYIGLTSGVIGLMVIVSVFLILIYRSIAIPIAGLTDLAKKTASGDLTTKIEIKTTDEIGGLGSAINKMTSSLKDIISKIGKISNTVSTVTKNIASASNGVFKGATVQHENIEKIAGYMEEMDHSISTVAKGAENLSTSTVQTSAAMTQMSTSIDRIADSANVFSVSASDAASSIEEMVASIKEIAGSLELLSSSSVETASSLSEINAAVIEVGKSAVESVALAEKVTSEASEKGMHAVSAAINGMDEIKNSVSAISEAINRLGKRSEEIGQIIHVIADVADRTSLLALNTSILAAQAGEHGKSFAVVAVEIKGLAGKTSLSTNEIAKLIKSVQSETRSSIEMAERGLESVDKGVKLVKEVSVALKSILESSNISTEKAKHIQKATTEESHVIKQITDAVTNMTEQIELISRATTEQSKGSKVVIAAIERISELAQHVKNATSEQSAGSRQITEVIGNVSHQAEQIASSTASQKEKSREMVHSIDSIKRIAADTVNITNDMNFAVKSMEDEAKTLLTELQRFKV